MRKIENYEYKPIPESEQKYLLSVCMAIYNSEDYLDKSIMSVLNQTYKNLQVILVDDGSTDGCGAICDKYAAMDKRVEVIHKKNGGLYTSRNSGVDAAKGDFICFLDGDDYMDPNAYECMISAILEEDADLAVCRYKHVYGDRTVDGSTGAVIVYEGHEMLEQFLKEDEKIMIQNCTWNKLYKKSLLDNIRFRPVWYEDQLHTPELLNVIGRGLYLDTAFHNYVCDRPTSIMNGGINERVFSDLIPNLYTRSELLESYGRHDLALVADYFLYKRLISFVIQVYRSDDPKKKEHLKYLDEHIKEAKDRFEEIFTISDANPNEYKKMKIYLKSRILYRFTMRLNDSVIIPLKQIIRRSR